MTALEEAKARMAEMQNKQAEDLGKIQHLQKEAQAMLVRAEAEMKTATETLDIGAYEKAQAELQKQKSALEMYAKRFNQIRTRELISEEESDKIIDTLLIYEGTLGEDFKRAIAKPLKELAELLHGYRHEVAEIETTMATWHSEIHANYSTRGRTSYFDEATGKRTFRSPTPVAVHPTGYHGCNEAAQLGEYLERARPLYDNGNG